MVTELVTQLCIAVPAIIAGNMTLTGAINGAFNIQTPWVKHLISWLIAVAAGAIFALTGGITAFEVAWQNILFGAGCGLVAGGASNGLYDWEAISNIIDKFYDLFGHGKTPTPDSGK